MAFDILTNSQIERIYSSNFVDLTNSLPQNYSNVTSSLISTNNDMSYSYNQLNHQMINGTFFQSVKPTFPSQSIDYQTELSIAIRVIAYVIIFIIAFVGNLLVILTLTCSRRMRTVTNTFLINLAISDLLLGIFCMPFTLYGSIARNFIFGSVMCKMIPYFQAISVGVSAWTLVIISMERYFAICHPLESRKWQTVSHSYRIIALIWFFNSILMSPIAVLSQLLPTKIPGKFKCREVWMSKIVEEIFNLSLNFILLIIPFFIMVIMYAKVSKTLYSSEFLSNNNNNSTGIHLSHNNTVHDMPLTKQGNENLENEKQLHQCIGQRLSNDSKKNFISKRNSSTNSNKMKFKNEIRSTTKITQDNNDNEFSTISAMNNYVSKEIDEKTIPSLTGTISPIEPESIEFDGNNILVIYNSKSGDVNLVESHLRRNFANQMKLDNDNNTNGDLVKHKNNIKGSVNNGLSTRKQNPNVKSTIKTRFGNTRRKRAQILSKKKIIRMLCVLVMEFFICWTPIYVLNTWTLYAPEQAYTLFSPTSISFIHLLAYISSCTNPITYCFMHKKFRQAMMVMLHCNDSRTDFSVSDGDQSGSNQSQSNQGGNNFITTVTNINQRQTSPLLFNPAIS